jgi:adenosine kinase
MTDVSTILEGRKGELMEIVLTGSVAFDYLMTFPGYFKDHILADRLESLSLSFLVESMTRLRGGVAPNIAYTLALLGQKPRLFATVGEDFEEYRAWLELKGVDTTWARVIPGEYTASFFVNTDRAHSQIASFYPGAMSKAVSLPLHDLEGERPDLVVVSPNDPAAMDLYVRECQELDLPYIYDPSQQIVRLSAEELRRGLLGAAAVFVNEYEFALIQKATGLQIADLLQAVGFLVVTEGKKGASIYTSEAHLRVPAAHTDQIVDPTGVGDAFRGGFLAGLALGLDYETCGQMGSLAATYCLEHRGTQGHSFTPEEFVSRYGQNFDHHQELENLLTHDTAA